jgi:hypothetical protein
MESTLLIFFGGIIIILIILRFTPNNKIGLMANFFHKVLPKIPFSEIIKALKG